MIMCWAHKKALACRFVWSIQWLFIQFCRIKNTINEWKSIVIFHVCGCYFGFTHVAHRFVFVFGIMHFIKRDTVYRCSHTNLEKKSSNFNFNWQSFGNFSLPWNGRCRYRWDRGETSTHLYQYTQYVYKVTMLLFG